MEQDTRHDIAVHSKFCQNTSQLVFCKFLSPWIYFRIRDSLSPIQVLMWCQTNYFKICSHGTMFCSHQGMFTPSEIEFLKQKVSYICTCAARPCEENFQVLGSRLLPSTFHLGKYFYSGGDFYHCIPGLIAIYDEAWTPRYDSSWDRTGLDLLRLAYFGTRGSSLSILAKLPYEGLRSLSSGS